MSNDEIEKVINSKRRQNDVEVLEQLQSQQLTNRLAVWGLLLTVFSMICTGSWLVAKIDSKASNNENEISLVVAKLDKVVVGLSKIEGKLDPITNFNRKQSNNDEMFSRIISMIAENRNRNPTHQQVNVGK